MPLVEISRPVVFNINARVNTNRALLWSVRFSVSLNRTVIFSVQSSVIKAAIDRILKWQINTNVRQTRIIVHSTNSSNIPGPDPFYMVRVEMGLNNGLLIYWKLNPRFLEPLPYTFRVQVGKTGWNKAFDWENVGSPLVNVYHKVDAERRWYGKTNYVHYRVLLTTGNNKKFVSKPVTVEGFLNWRDWHIAQEIMRKEKLRHKWFSSVPGYLLKQIRDGEPCFRCLSPYTEEPKDYKCEICYGTGKLFGYFPPIPLSYVDLDNVVLKEGRNLQSGVGMTKQVNRKGRFLAVPQLYTQDVWVDAGSGQRYVIQAIQVDAHIKGYPLIVSAELRLLPPDDVVYKIEVP